MAFGKQSRSPKERSKPISKTEFTRKYNNQVRIWEERVIDKAGYNDAHEYQHHPVINQNSKVLASKVEKIEKRLY